MALVQINKHPSRGQLRSFALLWFPAFCALVGFLLYRSVGATAAYAVWAGGAAISVVGLLAPAFMRLVFVGLMYLTFPIGFVVAHVLLGAIYYVVITPIGVVMRLGGYDPMGRRGTRESYWHTRSGQRPRKRYVRQV
ncbi:MAG TPA: SxtJ family membrane protein [Kofleriaceae bacterium]|nr:SxtJ family membrane protein [Kofleriaceae bacterium]